MWLVIKVDRDIISVLTLLDGRQEGHPACKNWVVRYWHGYLSGARCKLFAYGPGYATATPSSLAPVKEWFTFLVLAYPGCPGKRPLNRCSSGSGRHHAHNHFDNCGRHLIKTAQNCGRSICGCKSCSCSHNGPHSAIQKCRQNVRYWQIIVGNMISNNVTPSSMQENSGSEWTNCECTMSCVNSKSCCDVASSHGNSRTATSSELISNNSFMAFTIQPDLSINTHVNNSFMAFTIQQTCQSTHISTRVSQTPPAAGAATTTTTASTTSLLLKTVQLMSVVLLTRPQLTLR